MLGVSRSSKVNLEQLQYQFHKIRSATRPHFKPFRPVLLRMLVESIMGVLQET